MNKLYMKPNNEQWVTHWLIVCFCSTSAKSMNLVFISMVAHLIKVFIHRLTIKNDEKTNSILTQPVISSIFFH